MFFRIRNLTVVGSSKNTNAGLAMNANAALTFRLFPPLDLIEKVITRMIYKRFTSIFVLFEFYKFQDQRV